MAWGRRSFLRTAASVGLGTGCGCAAGERDAGRETPTATALPVETDATSMDESNPATPDDPDYVPQPTPVETPSAEVSIGERHGDDSPIGYELDVSQAIATTETPPRLTVEATNEAAESLGVGEVRTMRFWNERSGSDHELVLLPIDHGGSIGYLDGRPTGEGSCWHLDSRIVQTTAYRYETLAPGDSIASELQVWWVGPIDTCFPTGTFEFAVDYDVWTPGDDTPAGSGDPYRFGFTLQVERP